MSVKARQICRHAVNVLAISISGMIVAMPAVGGELPPRWKTGELLVGAYLTTFGTDARLDSDTVPGSDIDLENDTDLEESLAAIRADGYWRFFPRHRVEVAIYDISRSGNRVLDRDLQIGDTLFPDGSNLSSDLTFRVYKGAYAYSIVQTDNWDAAASIGVFAADLGLKFEGQIGGMGFSRESRDLIVPLPVIGGRVWYALTDDITLKFNVDAFFLKYEDYKGALVDVQANIDYDLTSWLGLTLGYNFVKFAIEKDSGNLNGRLDYQYNAILAAARVFF